jgi:hypothetical protein
MQTFAYHERSNKKRKDRKEEMDMEENKKKAQNIYRIDFHTAHLVQT